MNPVSVKTAMDCFLERTVAEYIQCLFSSTKDLRKMKLGDLVDRLNNDIELIQEHFSVFMTGRAIQKRLDIIRELSNFVSASPDFISMAGI